MKRTTVLLRDELHAQLRQEAFRSGVSLAQLIRSRLENASRSEGRPKPRVDPLLRVADICRGPVLSKSIDEELYGI